MKKQLLVVVLLLSFCSAKTQVSFNLGPLIAFGDLNDGIAAAGGSIEADVKVSPRSAIRAIAGFTRFPLNSNSANKIDFIPLRIGYERFVVKRIVVLGDAGVGTFFFPNNYHFNGLSFDIGGGYQIPLVKNYIRLSAYYDYTRDDFEGYYAWYNLRVAYGFNLGRKHL